MPFKVEAAVITQKGAAAQFNSDSININKKVLPREVAANGYKGAGTVSGKSFFALACAEVESCADAAVVSLNERSEQFLAESADVQNIFSEFHKDITGALTEMGHNSSAFSCALFYADENEVIISQTGSVKCFRYSGEKLYFVDPILADHEDALSQYGSCRFDDVKDGDLFFLLDENVADSLNNELLENIAIQCAGNTKVAVKLLLSKVDASLNAGAFVLKIFKSEDEAVAASVSPLVAEEKISASDVAENEAAVNVANEENKSVQKKSAGAKVAVVAVTAMLVVVLFVVGVFIGRYIKTVIGPVEESQSVVDETEGTTEETTVTTDETTVEAEETTDDESTSDETTTDAETTTRKSTQASSGSVVTTTRAPETTTRKPVSVETTTKKPAPAETTTKAAETTTVKTEESSTQKETTTSVQETLAETTTVAEEITTQDGSTETTASEQDSVVG